MKQEEQFALVVFVGILLHITIGDKVIQFVKNVKIFKENLFILLYQTLDLLMTWKTLIILIIAIIPFFFYVIYQINKKIQQKIKVRREKREEIQNKIDQTEKLLETQLENLGKEMLQQTLDEVASKLKLIPEINKLNKFKSALLETKAIAQRCLMEVTRNESLQQFEEKRSQLKDNIKELERLKEKRRLELENKNFEILDKLDADRTDVFFREELDEEQIEALHEEGWEDANEYDVMEKATIPVLVRKIMNHSKTHTFLVWSVERLLTSLGIRCAKHETRYPDITFYHNDEWWAIEVEKGSLLRKKNQMRAKVDFLNRHYPSRWMFVVSNKDLLPQYREWGFTTPRSGVEKVIENWLNLSL